VIRGRGLFVALGLIVLTLAAAGGVRAQTVVSLTFDDGIASQYEQARPQLIAHGMLATFYVNSGTIGTSPYYLSWAQVDTLHAEGNEIGGHTVNHPRLTTLSPAEARREICDDAANLRARGYTVLDFAYPYGLGSTTATIRAALQDCGFVSARNFGELRGPDCTNLDCPYAVTVPPADPYAIKTPGLKTGPYTLAELEDWVAQAETHGGGWVPIVFHRIENSDVDSTVSPADFAAFLDWLKARAPNGTVVKTVRSVMTEPPPAPPATAARFAFTSSKPADTATAFASLRMRRRQRISKVYVSASMDEPGKLAASGTVTVPNTAKTYRFRTASAKAVPGVIVKLRLKLSKKGLRTAKRALRRHRKLRTRITVTARDTAGNVKTAKRTVSLRR
jgi:peptidoglycan/xylan/chitin deacetylase (PgdA/CDA1 family)